jgi:hypothetical protein
MLNARFEDVALVPQAGGGAAELAFELGQVAAAPVAQLDLFQVAPDPLVRVRVRGVTGQGFEVQAPGRAVGQEVLDDLAPMDRGAIPDDQELAREVAQQVPEEAHHVRALEGAGQDLQQQAPLRGEAADRREVVARERDGQGRGVAPRGVGAHPGRQQVEPGLVDPDDRAPLVPGFFSRAGQRSWSQASTWAWSRWVARTSGCWTLRSSARRRRLTWEG